MGELGLLELLFSVFEGGLTFGNVLVGGCAIMIMVVAFRCVREKISPLEALGVRNGYLKEVVFLRAMNRIEKRIEDNAEAEGARMSKHSKEIGDLRDAVQCLDRKVEKVSTKVEMMEQFRDK